MLRRRSRYFERRENVELWPHGVLRLPIGGNNEVGDVQLDRLAIAHIFM